MSRTEMLEIRRVREQDLDALVALENECFNTYYREHRFSREDFSDYLSREKTMLLAGISQFSIIGYAAGHVSTARSQTLARLDSLAVLPPERNKGFGHQLMQKFIEEAKERMCTKIMIEVACVNENGISFFSKMGFQRIRRLPSYYGEEQDGLLMKLEI